MTVTAFISYVRVDKDSVDPIYRLLLEAGLSPWMDIYNLLPGENWEQSIIRAIKKSDIFVAILTNNSVTRRGVIQKELKLAIDKLDEYLPDDIFIIPIRLDDCEIPERLAHLQVLDWNYGKGKTRLIEALDTVQKRFGSKQPPIVDRKPKPAKVDLRKILSSNQLPIGVTGGVPTQSISGDSSITNYVRLEIFGKMSQKSNIREQGSIQVSVHNSEESASRRFRELKNSPPVPIAFSSASRESSLTPSGYGDECYLKYNLVLTSKGPPPPPPLYFHPQEVKAQHNKDLEARNYVDIYESFNITAKRCYAVYFINFYSSSNLYWSSELLPSEDRFPKKRYDFLEYLEKIDQQLRSLICDR